MEKKCFIGFDGYRDEIYRLIKERTGEGCVFWDSMEDLGRYLLNNCGRSSDIELSPAGVRLGGNGPLMAGAMAALGIPTTCMGMLDGCGDLIGHVSDRVAWMSIGRANRCTALEFGNGKLMLGQLDSMEMSCEDFISRINWEELIRIWKECSLIGIVNWSAFLYMNDILLYLEPFLTEPEMPEFLFFDLADLSARSQEDMKGLASLLKRLAKRKKVILGLNKKEEESFTQQFRKIKTEEPAGRILAEGLPGCMIVTHGSDGAQCFWNKEEVYVKTEKIENPVILTGAGDHFNAGFCTGMLRGMGLEESLRLGNRAAGYYIGSGRDMEEIAYGELSGGCPHPAGTGDGVPGIL